MCQYGNSNWTTADSIQHLTPSALARLLVCNQSVITSNSIKSVHLCPRWLETVSPIYKPQLSVVSWDSNVNFGNTPIYIPRFGDCIVVRQKKYWQDIHKDQNKNGQQVTKPLTQQTQSTLSSQSPKKAQAKRLFSQWSLKSKIKYLMKSSNKSQQQSFGALFRFHSNSSYTSTHAIANTYHYLSQIDAPQQSQLTQNIHNKKQLQSWRVPFLQKRLVRWLINYFTHQSGNVRVVTLKQIETAWHLLLLFSAEKRVILVQQAVEHYSHDALRFYNNTVIRVFNSTSFILAPLQPLEQRVMKANELSLRTVISACGLQLHALVNALNHLTSRFQSGHLTSSRAIATAYAMCCQLLCSFHQSFAKRDKHKKLFHLVRHNMYTIVRYLYRKNINKDNIIDINNNDIDKWNINNNNNSNAVINMYTKAQYILQGLHSVMHLCQLPSAISLQQPQVSLFPRKVVDESDIVLKIQDGICEQWKLQVLQSQSHILQPNEFVRQRQSALSQTLRCQQHQQQPFFNAFMRSVQQYQQPSLPNLHITTHTYSSNHDNFFNEPSAFFAPSQAPQNSMQPTSNAICIDCTKLSTRYLPMSELNIMMSHMLTASEINKHILFVLSATVHKFIMPDSWVEAKHTERVQEAKLQLFIGKRKHKSSRHADEVNSESVSDSDSSDLSADYTKVKTQITKFAPSDRAAHSRRVRRQRRGRGARQRQ